MSLTYHRSLQGGLVDKYAEVAGRLGNARTVLDIGCHTGYFVEALRQLGYDAVGTDADAEAVAVAQQTGLPVTIADVEGDGFVRSIGRRFDAICLLDVLEHLLRPRNLLENAKELLEPGGRLLITGPNVAYWAVRKNLLLGRWNYTDGGILDRTHLWFFTSKTWTQLVESAGFRVEMCVPAEGMFPLEHYFRKIPLLGRLTTLVRKTLLSLFPNLFAIVFLIEATPTGNRDSLNSEGAKS